jgi:ATP-dependent DNA helicase RecQ
MVRGVGGRVLGGTCGLLGDPCGRPELTRRDADEALEVVGELALVREAGVQGDLRRVQKWLKEVKAPGEIAIIAPRWKDLGGIRLLLENEGIPTQALDRGSIRLTRSLATYMLLQAIQDCPGLLLGPTKRVEERVRKFLEGRGRSLDEPTVRALLQIAQDIDRERGAGIAEEMLPITGDEIVSSIREFDAANDMHRDDQAVLVTSCHGAKGLEFTRVILLWDGFEPTREDINRQGGQRQAWEEKRRLFYVAMTRAKEELVMCGVTDSRLVQETAVPIKPAPALPETMPRYIVYRDLTPEHVDLGYSATQGQQDRIKQLQEGQPLRLRVNWFGDGWLVYTQEDVLIGDLSRKGDEELKRSGLGAGSFSFNEGEVRVGRIYRHLKIDDITGKKLEDWFVVIPQIRVCR